MIDFTNLCTCTESLPTPDMLIVFEKKGKALKSLEAMSTTKFKFLQLNCSMKIKAIKTREEGHLLNLSSERHRFELVSIHFNYPISKQSWFFKSNFLLCLTFRSNVHVFLLFSLQISNCIWPFKFCLSSSCIWFLHFISFLGYWIPSFLYCAWKFGIAL